jgi:hypothetical protein
LLAWFFAVDSDRMRLRDSEKGAREPNERRRIGWWKKEDFGMSKVYALPDWFFSVASDRQRIRESETLSKRSRANG